MKTKIKEIADYLGCGDEELISEIRKLLRTASIYELEQFIYKDE